MVIPMVYCCLLVFRFYGSLYKGRGVTFDLFLYTLLLFRTWLFIFVLEVPSYEHILGLKDFIFLLVGPHIYEHTPSNSQDSMYLRHSSNSECSG